MTSANRHRPKVTFHLQRRDVTDDVDVAALFVVKIHQRHGDEPVYIEKLFTLSEVSHQRRGDEPVYIEKLFTLSEVSHQRTASRKPEKGVV